MKAIILISSLFYLLGLKISNTVDIFKKTRASETIITKQPVISNEDGANASFKTEIKKLGATCDSTETSGSSESFAPRQQEGLN